MRVNFRAHLRQLGCNCDPELGGGEPIPETVEVVPGVIPTIRVLHDPWCPILEPGHDRIIVSAFDTTTDG